MQCVTHPSLEAVDVCRTCGKPICAACEDRSGASCLCEACCPQPEPCAAEPPRVRPRSPLAAAFLSILPGLGQAANGQPLKGLAFFAVFALLVYGATDSGVLGPFAGLFWLFQIYEAWHGAGREAVAPPPGGAPPSPAGARLRAVALLVVGGLFLAENLTGGLHAHLRILLPALVIAAGLTLLVQYFRGAEGERA